MKIGCIGLGDQGGPMAEMLLAAALGVVVWTRRASASEPFRDLGARVARDPLQLAAEVDLLSLCVTGDSDVEEVLFTLGVLGALRAGTILAIHSTVRPDLCKRVAAAGAARGVRVLDAPVSGSAAAARSKSLLMMVGGESEALDRARAAFGAYASPVVHMGDSGSGMVAKLIHNLVAATHVGIAANALAVGRGLGLDPDRLRQAMLAGTARSFGIEAVARLSEPNRAKHIVSLLGKDVELARANDLAGPLHNLFPLADHAITVLGGWAEGHPGLVERPSI